MVRRNTIGNTAEEINLDFLHEQLLLAMKKIKIRFRFRMLPKVFPIRQKLSLTA